MKDVYEKKDYTYLDEILTKIVQRREDESVSMDDTSSRLSLPELKTNLATVEKPDLQVAKDNRYKRMGKKESN